MPKRRVKILFSRVTQNCQYYKLTLLRHFERQLNLAVKPADGITACPRVRCFGCACPSDVDNVGTSYCQPLPPLLNLRVRTSGPEQGKILFKTYRIPISSLRAPFTAPEVPTHRIWHISVFSFLLCHTLLMILQEGI